MKYRTITIITPKGKYIPKTFRINDMGDLNYLSGYIQACKDKGAEIVFEDKKLI